MNKALATQSFIHYELRPTGGGSDLTLKKDVHNLDDSLDRVLSLRPVTWRWKASRPNDDVQYGFIAQEVADVLPQFVNDGTWEDGTTRKFLNIDGMVPYLVGAIKEQQRQIKELQARIDVLAE